jgi:hypothetical protein
MQNKRATGSQPVALEYKYHFSGVPTLNQKEPITI